MTDMNPKGFDPNKFDHDQYDEYGKARYPLADSHGTGAGMALVGIVVAVGVLGAMLYFFGPSKDYTVKHEDLARSPAATAPTPMPPPTLPPAIKPETGTPGAPVPLANPPQATPAEPQK